MKKIVPLLCLCIALESGTVFAGPTESGATRTIAASDAGAVKAGVDAWSAGNYAGAVKLWQPIADKGDADAMFNLAQAYKLGRGVPVDLARAEDLYGKAAAKGHVQAADSYGLLLFQRGDRTGALPYLQASAARGDARAMYILGVAHFNGDFVKKDWVRAYALTSLARDAGLAQAARALAQMDQYVPMADRQKSVALGQQLTAQAEANRQRLSASAELGNSLAYEDVAALATRPPAKAPEIVAAENAAAQAALVAGTGPASAGADYTRPRPTAPRATPPTTKPAAPLPAPKQATVPKPPSPPATRAAAAPGTSGPWRVQLGAFGVPGNAEALWAKVRSRPELAGHAKALVPAGKLTKLQATGFASQAQAQAACSRLASAGVTCLPVRD